MGKQRVQGEYLWVFRQEKADGGFLYTAPMSAKELDEGIKKDRLTGEVCCCIVIPDFKTEVEVKVPWGDSKFEPSDNKSAGSGGSVNGSEVSQGQDSSLRAEVADLSGGTGNGIEAGAAPVLDSAREDL